MQQKLDEELFFASLRARGIEYQGDEEWHLAQEANRLQAEAERRAEEAEWQAEMEAIEHAKAESTSRMVTALLSDDDDAFVAELDRSTRVKPSERHSRLLEQTTVLTIEAGYTQSSQTDPTALELESFGPIKSTPLCPAPATAAEEVSAAATIAPTVSASTNLSESPSWLVTLDDEPLIASPESSVVEVPEVTSNEQRWTLAGIYAYHAIRRNRLAILAARSRVFSLKWEEEAHSGSSTAKKFPFPFNRIDKLKKKKANDIKEEREVFHPHTSEHLSSVTTLMLPKLPLWSKLPAQRSRSSELQEVIAGARFASIAQGDDASLDSWCFGNDGDDVCCVSIELAGNAAERFLQGEKGDIGAALHRGFRRRLERDLGFVAMGAIWTRSTTEPNSITIFMMIRAPGQSRGSDVADLDTSNRFYESLVRHGVTVPPGRPIDWLGPHLAGYLGMTEAELDELKGRIAADDPLVSHFETDLANYTPESGFATKTQKAAYTKRSHEKWLRFTRTHGMPAWISAEFIDFVQDYFMHSPEHVRERQRVRDAIKHRRTRSYKERKALIARHQALLNKQVGASVNINFFRASPALFAALAMRSGQVLGDYWDSQHKKGRAKELYEMLRSLVLDGGGV